MYIGNPTVYPVSVPLILGVKSHCTKERHLYFYKHCRPLPVRLQRHGTAGQ